MRKRGQVTLFAILGIVLLLVIAFILSLQRVAVQDRLDREAQATISDFIQANALQDYVSSCLDKVTSQGVYLLGQQGGVIYESQGGLTPDKTNISRGTFFLKGIQYYPYEYLTVQNGALIPVHENISYAIRPYVNCPSFSPPVPINLSLEATGDYPVRNTFFSDYTSRYENYYFSYPPGCTLIDTKTSWSGFLGLNNLPPLCAYNGPNVHGGICNVLFGFDSPEQNNSMERQLATYIEHVLPVCVNFSIYEDILGSNITIIDAPNVSIYFQKPRGLLVQVAYPFEVHIEGKQPIIKQVNFKKKLPINLNQLFNFMYIFIKNAVRDPYFSLHTDWNNSTKNPFYTPNYNVRITQPNIPCEGSNFACMDDVLTVTDQSSLLFGKPLTFQFAVRERKPVLDYLHNPNQFAIINNHQIDYQYQVNDVVPLKITAVDPDDDAINITIKGWKQDYDDYFNRSNCTAHEQSCNLSNHWKYIQQKPLPADESTWSDSLLFQSPTYIATHNTTDEDVGLHNVTVIVEDEHGLKDFQIVRLLIFDLPKAVLELKNMYADISNHFASVEDPFVLNGSKSTASTLAQGDLTDYIFTDITEPFTYSPPHANSVLYLPIHLGTTIQNITSEWFNQSRLSPDISKEHNISLVVKQGTIAVSLPTSQIITVAQCLPHGYKGYSSPSSSFSKEDFATLPYPFFIGSNPHNASHVCCQPTHLFSNSPPNPQLEGGTYASASTSCFATTFNTTYPYHPYPLLSLAQIAENNGITHPLLKESYNNLYGNSYEQDVYGNIPFAHDATMISFDDERLNDIFTVSFEQFCSGNRGNVCGGEVQTIWQRTNCADFGQALHQFARCQGPSPISFNTEQNNLACENYTGASYERRLSTSFSGTQQDLVQAFNSYYSSDTLASIQQGFCAGPQQAQFNAGGNLVLTGGDFSCMAKCDEGTCAYTNLQDCSCNKSNVCDALTAQSFKLGNALLPAKCVDSDGSSVACLNDCTVAPIMSAPACTCRGGTPMISHTTNICCEAGVNLVMSDKACIDGVVLQQNNATSSAYGNALFCNGEIYICILDTTLADAPALPSHFHYATQTQNRKPCGDTGKTCLNMYGGQWY